MVNGILAPALWVFLLLARSSGGAKQAAAQLTLGINIIPRREVGACHHHHYYYYVLLLLAVGLVA